MSHRSNPPKHPRNNSARAATDATQGVRRANGRASRRGFMAALGLGAGGAMFLPSLFERRGVAAPGDGPPLRVIFVFNEHGTFYPNWSMRPPGVPTDAQTGWEYPLSDIADADFSPVLAPLAPFKNRMMVLDGLALVTAMSDPYGDGHAKGWVASLTGAHAKETYEGIKSFAATHSLDQWMRAHLLEEDPTLTDLVSMEFTIAPWSGTFHHLNYALGPNGQPYKVPWESDPANAFSTLFPSAAGNDPIAASRLDVLAAAKAQYEAMAPRLSGEDRAKLELHRDLIDDLHRRVTQLQELDCPAPSYMPWEGGWEWENNTGELMNHRINAFVDLIATSFSCGVARVVTLGHVVPPMDTIGGVGDFHHDYAHQSAWDAAQEKIDVVTAASRRYHETIAQLATRLDQIPEGNGTVLDNTVIVSISELANGGHEHDPWPVTMIGGAAGKFAMGRYIRFPQTTPFPKTPGWNPGGYVGQPHNRLLVSLAQAMGIDTDRVGLASVPAVLNDGSSVTVGLTGRLEELYG